MTFGGHDHFGEYVKIVGNDNGGDTAGEERVYAFIPIGFIQAFQEGHFHFAHALDAVGFEIFIEAGEMQTGAIDLGSGDEYFVGGLGKPDGLELGFLDEFGEADVVLFAHYNSPKLDVRF